MPNSSTICEVAGATMEEDTGEMNVKKDTITVAIHFFRKVQLMILIKGNNM